MENSVGTERGISWEYSIGDRVSLKLFDKDFEGVVVGCFINGHGARVYEVSTEWQRRANELVRVDTAVRL